MSQTFDRKELSYGSEEWIAATAQEVADELTRRWQETAEMNWNTVRLAEQVFGSQEAA